MTETQLILASVRSLERTINSANSPWRNRAGAAAYCCCGLTTLDEAANKGRIRRYWRGGIPLFKTAELDKWIEGGTMPPARLREMGAPCS